MKIAVVFGTRPEIIKMAPVIKELGKRKAEFFVVHTNQHYTEYMDAVFFRELKLKKAKYNLGIGSMSPGKQTGKMISAIENVLIMERPGIVLVEGDTNTVLAGAIAAKKTGIMVGHVEAGLRSYDMEMPEELNRIMVDHISDLLFAPTTQSRENLLAEGIPRERIFVTGNTIVDAVRQNSGISKNGILARHSLEKKGYILVTLHRQENADNRQRLSRILKGIGMAGKGTGMKVVFPLHPRTAKMAKKFGLKMPPNAEIIEPPGYLDFLALERNASLILTDSGGVQEEACILGTPCVTLRDSTERPETLEVKANVLAGADSGKILRLSRKMLAKKGRWKNPFGNMATEKIVERLLRTHS